ncbi:hypothetical protein GKD33_08825 [Parabacteroides merdae]|uniref:Uncharacterized protein n=1 Tax=Parabacteroides merdae TaxID=46503 RepID=A0A6L6P424_9BACT|nr:hypothetical protein [Parabacteroides merdae]MTT11301.1 hypothetical protein [Parabacteroides merdae]MTT15190.1 hypothetical protein [Parabacteroides merdae]MTT23060.1 hypothetical protein [Parabacteroides merdae]MTT44392.1 hypothetical protein [Parabacteroides merdae]
MKYRPNSECSSLNGFIVYKHKMDALISQSTHYTQFIYEPNLIGEESPSES